MSTDKGTSKTSLQAEKECRCSGSELLSHKLNYLYLFVAVVFITQILLYVYLYSYISHVEEKLSSKSVGTKVRLKRETTDIDNAVHNAEGAKVEFFDPKIRQELEEDRARNYPNGTRRTGPAPAEEDQTNPWVWLTSYSRIPVRRQNNILFKKFDLCFYL
jgi:hypothetical protein